MKKKFRRRLTITVIVILAIMLGIAIFKQEPVEYTYTEHIVASGDTFWTYYNNGYYADVCYSEALYTFKQDNNMDKYSLQVGQTVILRKVVE